MFLIFKSSWVLVSYCVVHFLMMLNDFMLQFFLQSSHTFVCSVMAAFVVVE